MANKKPTKRQKMTSEMEEEMIESMENYHRNKMDLKVKAKFKNEKQRELYDMILKNRVTFVKGSAGCGKTFIALKAALEAIKKPEYNIKKMIFTKPVVPSARDIGFLKGTLEEKTAPYFSSFYSNLNKLVGSIQTEYLKTHSMIEEKIINYMRGDTFGEYDQNGNPVGYICIGDEFQNTTISEFKTFISRIGENSKLIILGDIDQTDIKLPPGEKNGLEDAFERFKGIEGIGFFEFSEEDIIRDKFLIEIMKRYKN